MKLSSFYELQYRVGTMWTYYNGEPRYFYLKDARAAKRAKSKPSDWRILKTTRSVVR